jgi:hypothetical protein
VAAIVQACFGGYHHYRYVRDKPSHRRWFTHVHLWLGRTVILCGLANCGFGIIAAGKPVHYAILWWIGSGVLAGLYFTASIILAFIRRREKHSAVKYGPAPTPEPFELNTYQGSQINLLNQPSAPGYSSPPGRYEQDRYEQDRYEQDRHDPDRYGAGERYTDQAPEPYDPPRRQFEPVPRSGSPRQDLHLAP